jgi:anti-sigma regulatory factor (Ser/Thr protein kinase)
MNATGLPGDDVDPAVGVPPPVDVEGWVAEVAEDLPERTAADFALVAAELVENAHRHAEGPLLVRLRRGGGALRVEVRDRSPSRLPVLGKPGSPTSGSGLLLVNRLSSHWGFECHEAHKVVWAEVRAP